jgi:hypothetical protein
MIKKLSAVLALIMFLFQFNGVAWEKYGKTLNLGLGIGGYAGYYGYANQLLPVFNINYEFDIAKNFTLAPSVSFYSFTNKHYWGNNNHPYAEYTYRETVIPIAIKGSYYFDDMLKAGTKWDFYLAGSLGASIVNRNWSDGYEGDKNYYHGGGALFFDAHLGTEYHFNNRIGAFLDLSTGVSTIGLAIHGR